MVDGRNETQVGVSKCLVYEEYNGRYVERER